jgi:secreted PhoX family phosphatase
VDETMKRSRFLRAGVLAAGALLLDPRRLADGLAATCSSVGPYGPLGAPDARGIRLSAGFTSRVVARAGSLVKGTSYGWHQFPDGGACFPRDGGGWVYVSNSEVGSSRGGVSAIRFNSAGGIVGAKRICSGTTRNCSGGPTPWGTWLTCEENLRGRVFECWPWGEKPAVKRLALGRFRHEAAGVDPARKIVYLTEDETDGRLYRFRYLNPGDLTTGTLEVATVDAAGSVSWTAVPDPAAVSTPTRYQVAGSTVFKGGEGAWFGGDTLHFVTKFDNKVWAYNAATGTISVIYDDNTSCNPVLKGVDNVTVAPSGDIYVAEDGGDMQLVLLGRDGSVSPFLQVTGQSGSECAGQAFSPDGGRLYFSSQRGGANGFGLTYEIRGPFRR